MKRKLNTLSLIRSDQRAQKAHQRKLHQFLFCVTAGDQHRLSVDDLLRSYFDRRHQRIGEHGIDRIHRRSDRSIHYR